jgi:membrane protein DedA with SNARE-associated domain
MELLTQLLNALWSQDYETLANPSMIGMLYFVLFMILFLENGLLPAAFLPGDSLLVLVGVLIAKGAMGFPETLLLLTTAASLGCWLSYIQGRWLGNTRIVQNWLSHLPSHYHQRAHHLFHKHGLSALLMGRFIAFVRTLLPTIAGLSGLNNARFQFFNWMSGLLWVLILTSLGYLLGKTPVFLKYEDQLMSCLMLLPVVLLVFGLIGSLVVLWKKNTEAGADNGHKSLSRRRISWLLGGSVFLCALFWLWLAVQQQESTLTIHPVSQGVGMPDGFSVWHHLDANGIRFKSITPQKDGLLIKFDSSAQGIAAKEVLGRALPHGYIIALLEEENTPTAWLSRLRDAPHRLG